MKIDSPNELKAAFAGWREKKRYATEAVPGDLLERARCAAKVYGVPEVVRATRVERSRLFRGRGGQSGTGAVVAAPRPGFSRLDLTAPGSGASPIAELETAGGLKLRVFAESDGMVRLLTRLCERGGSR